jgi:sporulation protein YlmC with PRC-barrel domain
MLEEITQLVGLQIYTHKGVYLGSISNVIVDFSESKVDSFYVENTNPALVEASRSVMVPYRWVQSIGDIVVLKHFPEERILLTDEEREMLRAMGMEAVPSAAPIKATGTPESPQPPTGIGTTPTTPEARKVPLR